MFLASVASTEADRLDIGATAPYPDLERKLAQGKGMRIGKKAPTKWNIQARYFITRLDPLNDGGEV